MLEAAGPEDGEHGGGVSKRIRRNYLPTKSFGAELSMAHIRLVGPDRRELKEAVMDHIRLLEIKRAVVRSDASFEEALAAAVSAAPIRLHLWTYRHWGCLSSSKNRIAVHSRWTGSVSQVLEWRRALWGAAYPGFASLRAALELVRPRGLVKSGESYFEELERRHVAHLEAACSGLVSFMGARLDKAQARREGAAGRAEAADRRREARREDAAQQAQARAVGIRRLREAAAEAARAEREELARAHAERVAHAREEQRAQLAAARRRGPW